MGTSESKIGKIPDEEISEGSLPSTPILAPKPLKTYEQDEFDPRSPTANICRTPIQTLLASADLNETTDSPYILDLDPRSPSAEITRTPIVINKSEDDLLRKVHRRNIKKTEQQSKIIGPKLLDSSPITSKPDANKRKSFVGVLETNIDFTETDIDSVLQQKCRTPKPKCIDVIKNEDLDPRSPTTDFIRTPIQIAKKIGEIDLNENESELQKNEKTEPISEEVVTIEETVKENKEDNIEIIKENKEDNIEIIKEKVSTTNVDAEKPTVSTENMNDKITIVKEEAAVPTGEELPIKVEENTTPNNKEKTEMMTTPLANLTRDVKDFDKKLSELIYEDNNLVVLPRVIKLRETNRNPLGVRNSGGDFNKYGQGKLKVSDRPRKFDGAIKKTECGSKIPVFKEKMSRKNMVQCENTPPRNMEKHFMKVKKSQWDNGDNTLII
ncbi:cell division cycle-associated protein 3-like [Aethina tumida]|uniref:cell division cycle-associated protein 3-like n=1 Tax=Aethina tumida TaxID=116153 RepID=UPI00096B183B|nr:cell division cycle-associated protein 3-like [Aethina tumida]